MLTLDFLHPGLMLFVRAFVCFGSTLLLYNDLYFPTGWAGETMSVLGRARFGFLLSAPDLSHFDLSMLLRSVAQLSLIPLALDFLHLGFFVFSRSFTRYGSVLSISSRTRIGFPTSLMDYIGLELSISPQTLAHFEPFLPVLDLLNLGLMLFPQRLVCLDLSFFALDPQKVESTSLLRDSAKFGSSFSILKIAKVESVVFVSDFVSLSSPLFAQSPS